MLTEVELQKKWESLTFTDDFIFSRVMHNETICRQVVELILGVRIGKISYLSAQDEHKTDPDSMRIIMDVFLRDENRIITVEMQTGHKKELPKRSRYYQSVADVSTTSTGTKYRDLPENILIFICTFDPFNRDFPRYTFQYTCNESPELKLKDGSLRIFLNTTATKLSSLDQKLQAFYHYLRKSLLSGVLRGKQPLSSAGGKGGFRRGNPPLLSRGVSPPNYRRHYMTWAVKMADARYDGYEEGFDEGFTEGREAGLQVGIQQGIEQGSEQAKIETAQNLLAMHLSLNNIAKATGLSLETLKNLQQGEIIPSR